MSRCAACWPGGEPVCEDMAGGGVTGAGQAQEGEGGTGVMGGDTPTR